MIGALLYGKPRKIVVPFTIEIEVLITVNASREECEIVSMATDERSPVDITAALIDFVCDDNEIRDELHARALEQLGDEEDDGRADAAEARADAEREP